MIDYNALSEAEQISAVEMTPEIIAYIENPPEAVQIAAIQSSILHDEGEAFFVLADPRIVLRREAMQLLAVRLIDIALDYIENPSEAVQLAAVQAHGSAIQYIPDPSEALQLAAMQQDISAFQAIRNPAPAIKEAYTLTRALGLEPGSPGFAETLQAAYDFAKAPQVLGL